MLGYYIQIVFVLCVCEYYMYLLFFANISSANLINIILFQIPCHPSHPSPKETTEYVCYK